MVSSPWNDSLFKKYSSKKLKFGYYFDDGVTISSPPVKRAILQTVKALESQGHEVISVNPPNVVEAVRIFVALNSEERFTISFPEQWLKNSFKNLRVPIKPDPMEPT